MSFSQDAKNGSTPLGSIRDRIKNFEFMQDGGHRPTSPARAKSPISVWNGDPPAPLRKNINIDHDVPERNTHPGRNTPPRYFHGRSISPRTIPGENTYPRNIPGRNVVSRNDYGRRSPPDDVPGRSISPRTLSEEKSLSRNVPGEKFYVRNVPTRSDSTRSDPGRSAISRSDPGRSTPTGNGPERNTERRQIRRSERREAALRQRESEIMAAKNEQLVDTSDDNSTERIQRAGVKSSEKRPPRVAPRVKEKPPEPAPRRRIQSFKESGATASKVEPLVVERQIEETLASAMSPESSSNEMFDLTTSDDPTDASSEDILDGGRSMVKGGERGKSRVGQVEIGSGGNGVDERKEVEVENVNGMEDDMAEEDGGETEEEEDEEDGNESEPTLGVDESESEEGEVGGRNEDDSENEDEDEEQEVEDEDAEQVDDDEEEVEDDVEHEVEDKVDEREEDDEIEEEEDSEDEDETDEVEEDEVDDEEGDEEEVNGKEEMAKSEERLKQDESKKRKEPRKKRKQKKIENKEIDKNEDKNEAIGTEERKTVEASVNGKSKGKGRGEKQSKDGVQRKLSLKLSKNGQAVDDGGEEDHGAVAVQSVTPTEATTEAKSRAATEKASQDEQPGSDKKARTKKAPRRTLSKNSLKLANSESDVAGKGGEVKAGRSSSKGEESDGSISSGNIVSKVRKVEEEKTPAENESVPASPTQHHFFSSSVLDLVSGNLQKSQPLIEEESFSSTSDANHDELPVKKAFVCAVHEEPCKYYCQNCERLICSECAMRWGDCHEHFYMRVKDAWKKYREEMLKILQDARANVSRIQEDILENSKSRDSFKLKVDSTLKKINGFFDEHIQALEKRRSFFLETVEEIMKFREIGINQEIEGLQNNLVETSGTINIAGRVYGTTTMMEFLQVCKQLTNRLMELGTKKCKAYLKENVDIDFFSEPNLFEDIEQLGQLKKHRLSLANVLERSENVGGGSARENGPLIEETSDTACYEEAEGEEDSDMLQLAVEEQSLPAEDRTEPVSVKSEGPNKFGVIGQQDSVEMESTENASESNAKEASTEQLALEPTVLPSNNDVSQAVEGASELGIGDKSRGDVEISLSNIEETSEDVDMKATESYSEEDILKPDEDKVNKEQSPDSATDVPPSPATTVPSGEDFDTTAAVVSQSESCSCNTVHDPVGILVYRQNTDNTATNTFPEAGDKANPKPVGDTHPYPGRRHSLDETIGRGVSKDDFQRRRLQSTMGRLRSCKVTGGPPCNLDEGERYFSSGEAEQRRRKQEYYKVRFNDRAYYSNPSDSSELEEMRRYEFEDRPMKQRVRRHRTMPLIRPISERQRDKCPWVLDAVRYHGKIHFSRSILKATGKAFGWNAVVGSLGFSKGKHSWKVRVTKWTAVGVCYKDDHIDNPSWGAGNKWTWDSADMCYSPRHGVCETPVGEWIDGDIIALELDCDNSLLVVHNLRTLESDKLYGFKEPVYPYFYLSVFRSINLIEIDGVQVG